MGSYDKQISIRPIPKMEQGLLKEFIELLKIPSTSRNDKAMIIYIADELRKMRLKYTIDSAGNLIVDKGTAKNKPCFVSHMDTVHEYVPSVKIKTADLENHLYVTSPHGIGGDDKCGIFVCLQMLKHLSDVLVIFFAQEESGCVGSNAVDLTLFDNCTAIIGIDRWGDSDYVNSYMGETTTSADFDASLFAILDKYKYTPAVGMLTDSLNLFDRGVDIPCINLSCGYYKHHTKEEYIDTNETNQCIELCKDIAEAITGVRYTHPGPAKKKYGNYYDDYDFYPKRTAKYASTFKNDYRSKSWKSNTMRGICDICGETADLHYNDSLYVCKDCIQFVPEYKNAFLK